MPEFPHLKQTLQVINNFQLSAWVIAGACLMGIVRLHIIGSTLLQLEKILELIVWPWSSVLCISKLLLHENQRNVQGKLFLIYSVDPLSFFVVELKKKVTNAPTLSLFICF